MKKAIAEFIGTFALVLVGCGAAVIEGRDLRDTHDSISFLDVNR